jgi:hypothetical protein
MHAACRMADSAASDELIMQELCSHLLRHRLQLHPELPLVLMGRGASLACVAKQFL